jgi:hypothetical protein
MSEYTLDWLHGDRLASVRLDLDCWILDFESGGSLQVACPWRLLVNETIRLSDSDHNQQYGLPAPINAVIELGQLLRGLRVGDVHVEQKRGDIRIQFASDIELQICRSRAATKLGKLSAHVVFG